jgi:hypothetical protein
MNWRERLQQLQDWSGWRRHAPAGFSVLAHVVVFGVLGTMMASAVPPAPEREVVISVQFVEPIAEMAGVTPPPRVKAPAPAERAPVTGTPTAPVVPSTGSDTPSAPGDDSVYLGPPQVLTNPGLAKGLAGLTASDACAARFGPKAKECAGRDLAARTGKMDSVLPRPKQELAQYFGAYMSTCPYLVGCEPAGEHITPSGTRAPPPQSAASAGAEQLGGIHDSVGRLDFNPDHFDRGFGD